MSFKHDSLAIQLTVDGTKTKQSIEVHFLQLIQFSLEPGQMIQTQIPDILWERFIHFLLSKMENIF